MSTVSSSSSNSSSSTSSTSSANSSRSSSNSESRNTSSVTRSSESSSFRSTQESTDSVPLPRERPDRVDVDFSAAGEKELESPRVGGLLSALGEEPQAELTPGQQLAETAEAWVDKEFKPGETARCADFVSQMVKDSGVEAPDFEATVRARDFANMGEPILAENLAEGDVVAFNNTYRNSANDMDHTHVGIYIGEGMMVHRPTSDAPVEMVSLEEYLARPTGEGIPDRSLAGGYRLTVE